MYKIMTIIGTRPELIKMSRVIAELDKHTDHVLVHSGQNYDYELNQIFFEQLSIRKPDYFLDVQGDTASQAIADVISKSDKIMADIRPDALLIYGDTNTGMAVLAAKRQKIPVFHMEAGNRCFDERVPEELNRKVIDHLSDINMVLTEQARQYLLREGIKPETIIKTGSHMNEVLRFYEAGIKQSTIKEQLGVSDGAYFLISAHREENVDKTENLLSLLEILNTLATTYHLPVIISTHPRTRKRLAELTYEQEMSDHIQFMKPFGFLDYVHLQQSARCVLSDSGTLTEEASLLNFPAVMLRNTHERPEGMDAGVLIMSGLNPSSVMMAIDTVLRQQRNQLLTHVDDYAVDNVSQKVVRIVLSYIEYINRTVWHKY